MVTSTNVMNFCASYDTCKGYLKKQLNPYIFKSVTLVSHSEVIIYIPESAMNFSWANLRRQVESQCIVGIEPTLTRTIPASFKSSTKDLKLTTT